MYSSLWAICVAYHAEHATLPSLLWLSPGRRQLQLPGVGGSWPWQPDRSYRPPRLPNCQNTPLEKHLLVYVPYDLSQLQRLGLLTCLSYCQHSKPYEIASCEIKKCWQVARLPWRAGHDVGWPRERTWSSMSFMTLRGTELPWQCHADVRSSDIKCYVVGSEPCA